MTSLSSLQKIETTTILGVPIATNHKKTVQRCVVDFLDDQKQHLIVTPNPEFLVRAYKDKEFHTILKHADLAIPDGFGLKMASYLETPIIQERFTGLDMVHFLSQISEHKNYTMYLLGGVGETAQWTARKLQTLYPNLSIIGTHHGFSPTEEEKQRKIISDIQTKKPDILLVAFGAPKQEKWLAKNLKRLPSVKIGIGVGGVFNYLSGRSPLAPRLIRSTGLEWLWRLITEPWRFRRIIRAVVIFPLLIIKEKFLPRTL